ncbi:LuxR C-terminal-related transcriptional regulator [Ruminococcaceae bacterium OttesenSCG-928-D13]|nr:LuxR C-terminal-related transcriptional regulator [Ruminococcaceae bacterium OttesenSCG-928-D13]
MPRQNGLPVQPGDMLIRPRLHAMIQNGLQQPLLVLLAGPGYGKTQAVASFLAKSGVRALWMRLDSLDNLQTHFWSHFIQTLAREFPSLSEPLSALEFPGTTSKFYVFIDILIKALAGEKQVVWGVDDFGAITDAGVKAFFWSLVEAAPAGLRIITMSNVLNDPQSIVYMTRKRSVILGKDLLFTRAEIAEFYAMHNIPLEPFELDEVERYTEGWPLPLHLLVLHRGRIPFLIQPDGRLSNQAISRMFESRFFDNYSPVQQKLLVKLSMPDTFTEEFALSLPEGAGGDVLEHHAFLTNEPATGRYHFHHLYRLFLQKQRYMLSEDEERQLWRHAAAHYTDQGNPIDAITCHRNSGDHAALLDSICDYLRSLHLVSSGNAAYILDCLDLLTPEEEQAYPIAHYLRARICLSTLETAKAEALLQGLERRLAKDDSAEARALLGECYAMLGAIHMMRTREDFGDYYKKAADCLPNGSKMQQPAILHVLNNHSFSMADNQPGALERMERAVHDGMPWAGKVLHGGMGGLEHIFSAEAAYLTFRFEDAQQHAYRTIYKAEQNAQHDLVCNAHCILARIGLMQGDYAEMTKQVLAVDEYAGKYHIGALKEIADTALGWYHIKLGDHRGIPRSILLADSAGKPELSFDRAQIVCANYLISTGEYAQLVGMLEYPRGLFMSDGIWPDRICRYLMLAIGYHHLGNSGAAMQALWTAYDMSHANGLITLFVEAGNHMCALADTARQQETYTFSPDWLDRVSSEASAFAARAASVRAAHQKKNPVKPVKDTPLTKREMEILKALSMGLTREEIAAMHFVSVNTVKTFIRSIYNKLDAANRAEAVSIAIARGYIDVSPPT